MAKNLLNKYVWLVETIYKSKKISFDEINRRWLDNDMSEDKPLPIRTFHKWRIAIEEMFGLIIENEQGGQYRYYIQNADDLKSGSMRSWLFNTTYQSFWRDEANTFEVEPYCLKAFKQRWYLVARSPYYDKIMIYALDRVHQLEPTGKVFKYPDDFVAEEYFEDCFGIIADQNYDVETVKLKVSAGQANYLRTLRLHQSQIEIDRNDEFSVFTVRLRPTFDFRQEILTMGSDIEVLSPKWFRDEMAEISKHMWNKYKNDK